MDYDFCGWATKNDLKCSDGRTIRRDAFKDNDGGRVPLVWNHQHNEVNNVLGHADLKNRPEGVYAYCKFNDTESGQAAKQLVQHGDVVALSIYANQLKQQGGNVLHGNIREVSLVLAGANPGAYIEDVIRHGETSEDEMNLWLSEEDTQLLHGDEMPPFEEDESLSHADDKKEDTNVANDKKDDTKSDDSGDDRTVQDVIDTMTDEQKTVMYAMVGQALEQGETDDTDDSEGGNNDMKHNVFDNDEQNSSNVLTHSDLNDILAVAKEDGSWKRTFKDYVEENEISHADATVSGFEQPTEVAKLFPEYQEVRPGAPELITNDQGWISTVLNKVHKSPISRIRTSQVDVRNLPALRAKGYQKGKQKKLTGNFKLIRRTTDPQTVYVRSQLHRDDIVDITDFDYVQYLYSIDRMNLNEELATAIMLGDGREDGAEDKIMPEHIRPIWTDDDLYTIHTDIDFAAAKKELQGTNTGANFGENYITAEAMVNAVLYAREDFKGSGTPDMYITPHMLNVMLLARDLNGRRIYSSVSEIAAALNVGRIYTAEQFENRTRKTSDPSPKTKKLVALIVNLNDYSLGATKGGEITHFTDFDIDFNVQKSLLETRCSGALTRVYSAIAVEEDVTSLFS